MSTTPRARTRWQRSDYSQIAGVDFDGKQLQVAFANGDKITIAPSRLLAGVGGLDWSRAVVDGPEIQVPGVAGVHAVSWLDVRALSDDDFAAYLAGIAEEEARQVGRKLRHLRESRGLSSAALALRAQITPQSLSRIELGRHDVVYSTLQRILAAMNYSLSDLQAAPVEPVDLTQVARRLKEAGLSKALVTKLAPATGRESQILDRLQRIFGWSSSDLIDDHELPIRASVAQAAAFKYTAAQQPELGAYVLYAHYLAALVHQATPRPKTLSIPKDPLVIRQQLLSHADVVDFTTLVDWAWANGISVVPLFDPGQFHGACWLFGGRPVVVLKQMTQSDARLAFDLAHEIGHVALHLSKRTPAMIEAAEIAVSADDDVEEEASDFAGVVILGDPERLVAKVVERADRRGERLKSSVEAIAPTERVAVGALANYLAWRLEGELDWWGTAANLQPSSPNAAGYAVKALRDKLETHQLADDDRALLIAALEARPGDR